MTLKYCVFFLAAMHLLHHKLLPALLRIDEDMKQAAQF